MKITDISLWQAFFWTANEQSFTRAAQKMKIGVPFLSKKIATLEQSLQTKLFQRTTRHVKLTDEGRRYLPSVTSILESLDELETKYENQEKLSGTIRFTCPVMLGTKLLSPIVGAFSELHPNVKFEIDVSDRVLDLTEEQMDFAVRIQEPSGTNAIFKKIAVNQHVFCASPQYLKKNKPVVRHPRDLLHHRLLILDVYYEYRIKGSKFQLRSLARQRYITGGSAILLTSLALNHAGIAIRSLWDIKEYLRSGALVQILENYPIEDVGNIHIVIPHRKFMPQRVRAFIDFLSLKARDWEL